MTRDLHPLGARLDDMDAAGGVSDDDALGSFLRWVEETGVTLYPAQEEAILELWDGAHVLVTTPTGSGKSMVAVATAFRAAARGERIALTFPVKALVSEKFFDLCRLFGPSRVGMMTGDASVNREAAIVCMTAEILANQALAVGDGLAFDAVVMDEFHYYGDRDRGAAWQIPLIATTGVQFVLMSATMGETTSIEHDLARRTGRRVAVVASATRPVPLSYEWSEIPLHEAIPSLVVKGRAPIYLVSTSQKDALAEAQDAMSLDLLSKDEKREVAAAMRGMRWPSPFGKTLERYLRAGVGVHHAGLLPRYRLAVEKLAQKGLLKLVSGTDTLGVGVNIPIRTVLFSKLCKFDGEKVRVLTAREFHQVAGRAGRRGFDDHGHVVVQAPEHVIENLRIDRKIAVDPSKKKKLVKKKPPERGYAPWDAKTFERLVAAKPEALVSRFRVTPAMVLSVVTREAGGCRAMKALLRDNHDPPRDRRAHRRRAMTLFRALVETGILELVPRSRDPRGLVLVGDLTARLSLHQPLSLFLLDALPRLPADSPTHALDVLSLVEAVLETPSVIVDRQVDKKKQALLTELKQAGVPYEDRIAELERVEPDKPLAETIYAAFDLYRKAYPWIDDSPRPKSIARNMVELVMSFGEYVREFGLERVEGTLLRYLTDVVRVLRSELPAEVMTDELRELRLVLEATVRTTDASLVEEWEKLHDPEYLRAAQRGVDGPPPPPPDFTRDERGFARLLRNEAWKIVRAIASRDEESFRDVAGDELDPRPFFDRWHAAHGPVALGAEARSPTLAVVERDDELARVTQTLSDDEGPADQAFVLVADLARCRAEGRLVVTRVEPA